MDWQDVDEYIERCQQLVEASPQMDEENTKVKLVQPFLELLGWDLYSTEVALEYEVPMASGSTHVDYALLVGDSPVVFVEAKPVRSTLTDQNVRQLKSYMRQELDVDWGILTNGTVFEVLTKNQRRNGGEEVSVVRFDLDDLSENPDVLELLSKESIRSGRADEIAEQVAQTGQAIRHLKQNREHVATEISAVLLDEIDASVPLDAEAQATEFVEKIISTLEEQRSSIGTISFPEDEREAPPSEIEDGHDISGGYVITFENDATTLATFADDTQSEVMAAAVSYLIEDHDLIAEIDSLPYIPGREKAIINDTPTSPHDEDAMRGPHELTEGYYLETHANKEGKKREVERLAEKCDLRTRFEGDW